ncbi:DUF4133 domain-containing protein [Daejeonella sp.]|uniref:DUF4133 domain-containing protein n=1 Tax=Daejeonella sp. TaxID=2805397 RepID=UPI0030BB6E56
MASVYTINKGINKSIEFKGLKAQFIAYLAIGLVFLLIAFAVLYIVGVALYICIFLVGGAGFILFTQVYRLSHKYGRYGLMKKAAKSAVPRYLRITSRKTFTHLKRT